MAPYPGSTIPARVYGGRLDVASQYDASGVTATFTSGNIVASGGIFVNTISGGTIWLDGLANNPNVIVTTISYLATGGGTAVINAGSGSWTIQNKLDLSTGAFNAQASSITVLGDISISTSGVFNAGTSTVTLAGAVGSTSTLSGAASFYTLQVLTPGKYLDLQAGATTTVSNLLNLQGTLSNNVGIRSTIGGQQAYLINSGTNTVSFVDAADNNASGGFTIQAGTTSLNNGNLVNWSFGKASPATVTTVYASSISVTWNPLGSNSQVSGYKIDASTASDFTGTAISSTSLSSLSSSLAVLSLASNSTYYLRLDTLFNGATEYTYTTPNSTSTLADTVSGAQIIKVGALSVKLNWLAQSTGSGAGTSEGYRVDASTASDFTGTLYSSATFNLLSSTLTVVGLTEQTTYYFRVGSLNWNNVYSFTSVGSTATTVGGAYYWISPTPSNWNNVNNWSDTSGGPNGVGVPVLNSQVVFDANGSGNCTIDTPVNILSLTISTSTSSGFTGIVDTSSNSITVSTFTMSFGTFFARTSTITIGSGGFTLSSGTYNGNSSSMSVTGDVTMGTATWLVGGSTVTVSGNFTFVTSSRTFTSGSSTFIFNGPAKTISTTLSPAVRPAFKNVTIQNSIQLNSIAGMTISGVLSIPTGNTLLLNGDTTFATLLMVNGSTVSLSGTLDSTQSLMTIQDTTVLGTGGILNAPVWFRKTLNTTPLMNIPARTYGGTVVTTAGSNSIAKYVLGSGTHFYNQGLIVTAYNSTSTALLDGSVNNPTVIISSFSMIPSLTSKLVLSTSPFLSVNAGSGSWTINNQFNFSTGTFNAQTASITIAGTTVSISSNAIFNAGTSTVTLANVAGSTMTINLPLTNFTTFYTLQALTPGQYLNFQSGATTTISNLLNLQGASGNLVGIRSTTPGQQAYWINNGTNAVSFVDAADNNASGGLTIQAGTTSLNNGNLVNWSFGKASPATITAVNQSSMTVSWTPLSSNSQVINYKVDVSTASDFSGTVLSSTSVTSLESSLSVLSLFANTTYYLRLDTLYSGATEYALTTPISTSTLADTVTNSQIYSASYSSVTLNWAAQGGGPGANTSEGYLVQASTANDYTGTIFSSATTNVTLSTLTVVGLMPQTTYYFRIGSLNWDSIYSYIPVGSTVTTNVPAPVLTGVALGVSSITWSWTPIAGATQYRVYQATSTTTLLQSQGGTSWDETGLSTNTAYGRVVTAIVSGVESPLSNSVTTYTLAAIPGDPIFSTVAYTSFTVTWADNGNPFGTFYEVSRSTINDNFATSVSTPIAFTDSFSNTTTTFINLTPATTYYLRIRAENGDSFVTAFSTTGSTRTLDVPVPGNFQGAALGVSSISWTWNTVSGASQYRIYQATSPLTLVGTSGTTTYIETALSTNTAYGRQVTAVVNGVESALSNSVTTYTLANPLNSLQWIMVGVTSTTVQWNNNTNPLGTLYMTQISADPTFVSSMSSSTYNTQATLGSLNPNTTYYVQAQAINGDGLATVYTPSISTSTLANTVLNGQIYTVMSTSVTLNWTPQGVGPGANTTEGYIVEASTASDYSGTIYSSATATVLDSTLTVTGLTINVQYYFRIGSYNWNNIPNYTDAGSATTIGGPAPINPLITAVYRSSMTIVWGSVNSLDGYIVQASTANNFTGTLVSSITTDGTSTSLSPQSLIPNTTYFVRVGSLWNGATTYALTTPISTSTWVDLLTNSQIYTVSYTSVTLNWTAQGVGPGANTSEGYLVQASTASDYSGTIYSSSTTNVVLSTLSVVGLTPATTYFFRVESQNWDAVYSFVDVGSTVTLPTPAPLNFHGTALGVSSISWTWDAVSGASQYRIYQATSPSTLVGTSLTTSFVEIGLSTNTAYGRQVTAIVGGFESALSASATVYTLAAVPGQPIFSNVAFTSFTITWATNSNPGTTPYEVSYSTTNDNFATGVSTPIVLTDHFTGNTTNVVNLLVGTTYYVRLRAANGDGFVSAFSVTGSTQTLSIALPMNFRGTALGISSISWTWDSVPGASSYNIYMATSPATVLNTVGTNSWIETGLSTNTAYGRAATAIVGSFESHLSNSATVYTFAMPPTNSQVGIVTPISIDLSWSGNTNPNGTSYQVYGSTSIGFVATTSSFTVANTATLSNLTSNTTYYLHVKAQNGDGIDTAYDITLSTLTNPATPNNGVINTVTSNSIDISWGAATNPTGTQYQAEVSTISFLGASTQVVTGTSLSASFTNLTVSTTYYIRVKAIGWTGLESNYLDIGSAVTIFPTPTNLHFTTVDVSSFSLAWDPILGSSISYTIDITSGGFSTISVTTTGVMASFTGLDINTLFYAHVKATDLNSSVSSAWSTSVSTYTLANPPILLSTTVVTSFSVGLLWNSNNNPASTLYTVERSADGVTFTAVTSQAGTNYTDTGLNSGTIYYYRVMATNGNNIPTAYTNTVQVRTTGNIGQPARPHAFWAEKTDNNVTFHWRIVSLHTDGTALTNLAGYRIYKSSNPFEDKSDWTLQTTVTDNNWSTTVPDNEVAYYCVRAVDDVGTVSEDTHIMDDSIELNHYFIGDDNLSHMTIPERSAKVLRREHNTSGSDITIVVMGMPAEETGRVVRSLWMKAEDEDSGNEVTDLIFDPAIALGTIHYTVQNGQVVAGAPNAGGFRTPIVSAAQAPNQLSLFIYDGRQWNKSTSQINTSEQALGFTASRVGHFQIRIAARSTQATLTRVAPRIFTPNGDGWNDKVVFHIDNPEQLPLAGKIFDLSGAFVANMAPGPEPESSMTWNGKDSSGQTVPGGIYLYQLDLSGQVMTGTVVVAR